MEWTEQFYSDFISSGSFSISKGEILKSFPWLKLSLTQVLGNLWVDNLILDLREENFENMIWWNYLMISNVFSS